VFSERFGSIGAARAFMADFIDGYNHNHRHTGIGLNTPADVHYGLAPVLRPLRSQDPDPARHDLDQQTPEDHRNERPINR
jgi:putative transposase